MINTLEEVKGFWNAHPCQADLSAQEERRRYFEEISQKRYGKREWYVPIIAQFDKFKGKRVLEVGCSIATDGLEFAKAGAVYTGVDLTPNAIELAKERFGLYSVPGEFRAANAEERLPFPDNSFDHAYSFGVIHHSPHPERIVAEIHRVLRPGGTFTIMLYNRNSINYYIEILFLRRIFRWLLLPSFMPGVLSAITGFDKWKLEGHREKLKKKLTKQEWVSMNTDGPYCPLARVYNKNEVRELFHGFKDIRQEVWEFNPDHWPLVRRFISRKLERWLGSRWGWSRVIRGVK
jgi:ubiquinone/menaquinone biosynthesis C-methylase UbiE